MESLDEMVYLTQFIKEVLRISAPGIRSLGYKAIDSFQLQDGVQFKKGDIVVYNIIGAHFHPKSWKDPEKFDPNRFDPEHEMFKRPDGGVRHSLAFCPFTFGKSGCPGRSLAMMDLKVMFIYFVLYFDF